MYSIVSVNSYFNRHRGASAISWTLIQGDTKGGFTVFWPDDGLDTGKLSFMSYQYDYILP